MNVSRETQIKLDCYLALLTKWNPKINLVSPSTINDADTRHFEDSLQVANLCPATAKSWVDLGSGGGFPGAVVAIALSEMKPDVQVTLIESDLRKAAFLRTVSRETNVPFTVISERIEHATAQGCNVLSARALAPLDQLCGFSERHLSPNGIALFQKGERWQEELASAQKKWNFSWKAHKSVTNPKAVVLEIGELTRA